MDICVNISSTSTKVREEICEIIKALLLCREDLAVGNECLQSALEWLEETTDMGVVMPPECQCTLQVMAALREWNSRDFNLTVFQGEDYNKLVLAVSSCNLAEYRRITVPEAQEVLSSALGGLVGSHFFLLKEATNAVIKLRGTLVGDKLTEIFWSELWKPAHIIRGDDIDRVTDVEAVYRNILERSTEASFMSEWVVISNFPSERLDPLLFIGDIINICRVVQLDPDLTWFRANYDQEGFLVKLVHQATRTFMVKLDRPYRFGSQMREFCVAFLPRISLVNPRMVNLGGNINR
jgi:hypothetical protein